jgi:hypothetical protein
VAGLEAIVGSAIIADPAAQMADLESRVQGLQQELSDSQAQADLDAAADVRDKAIADARARVAEARAALDALKAKIAEAIGTTGSPVASPAASPSAA